MQIKTLSWLKLRMRKMFIFEINKYIDVLKYWSLAIDTGTYKADNELFLRKTT